MVVLNESLYKEICNFINEYDGAPIDCEKDIIRKFTKVEPNTLLAIISKEWQHLTKRFYSSFSADVLNYLLDDNFNLDASLTDEKTLLNKANESKMPPMTMCRIILNEVFKHKPKKEINEMMKNPHLISMTNLARNVIYCLFNDSRDGIIPDLIKQCIGVEYETKLKQLALSRNLVFYDEGDLRKTGFDKTPDIKLAIPCLYKGFEINWIESKASFGDEESHHKNIKEQISCYINRFGPGLVIYWFGYVNTIRDIKFTKGKIFVADSFPLETELTTLNTIVHNNNI